MDIEEFYDQNPARRTSEEFEFGRDWSDADGNHAEVSWVQDTGELYLMTAPFEPILASGLPGQEDVAPLATDKVLVDVLGVFPTVEAVEGFLSGWRDAMAGPSSVEWLRDRIANPGSGGVGPASGDEPTELPGAHPSG